MQFVLLGLEHLHLQCPQAFLVLTGDRSAPGRPHAVDGGGSQRRDGRGRERLVSLVGLGSRGGVEAQAMAEGAIAVIEERMLWNRYGLFLFLVPGGLFLSVRRREFFLAAVAFVAVLREGIEAALFLVAAAIDSSGAQVLAGAAIGTALALAMLALI